MLRQKTLPMPELELTVAEFVALVNQTLEFAYPSVTITGELANFRVSKNRWVYFDLKDEGAIVHFFGTVYQLPGPLEDGLLLRVQATPRLHSQYGFSLTVQKLELSGEGSIKRAASLLEAKLAAEGLFDPARKRPLPYPPNRIGLITSDESAAYSDFVKVLGARWGGLEIVLGNVQVQGESAAQQIIRAIEQLNTLAEPPEVLVIVRGGGATEDLQAFSAEQVVRAVAASRIPTLVAIGHERDISLAELAADQRASTPSNAAELLVPDKLQTIEMLHAQQRSLLSSLKSTTQQIRQALHGELQSLFKVLLQRLEREQQWLAQQTTLVQALSPEAALSRGYGLVLQQGSLVGQKSRLKVGQDITVILQKTELYAKITSIKDRSSKGKFL